MGSFGLNLSTFVRAIGCCLLTNVLIDVSECSFTGDFVSFIVNTLNVVTTAHELKWK